MAFTHLHLHTTYSICDAIVQVDPLFDKLKQIGQTSVAMTDHGNMYGAIVFHKAAAKAGIKPIIGCEFYLSKGRMTERKGEKGKRGYTHIVLLAKNDVGYKNIIKLSSIAFTKGFYYKPRIDKETLFQYREGLICLPACLAGPIQQLVIQDRYQDAIAETEWFQSTFGEDFYLEIQNHGISDEQKIRTFFGDVSQKLGIPIVATNDVHYLNMGDSEAHEVMLCIGSGKNLDDPQRMRYDGGNYHLTTEQEMRQLFPDFPASIDTTQQVVDKVNFELDLTKHYFPKYEIPQEHTLDTFLEKTTYDGAKEIFGDPIPQEVDERIKFELEVIKKCGFSEYFLVVYDFIKWAKDREIATGPGRGSAAGSMVVYCLGITQVNPLEYGLFFERFLNPERISMPDIDIDFCFFRRQDVINYVIQKYGKENVSNIITFGVLGAKSVMNAVAKVLGISFQDSQRLSKMVLLPSDTLANNIEASDELKEALQESGTNRRLHAVSQNLEGCIKYAGIHASGIVVASGGIDSFVPLTIDKEGQLATQFDMESVDAAGMLKVDFLGLRTMTVINETIRLVKQRKGIDLDLNKIPMDDPKVYSSLERGETSGVFQLESHGMRKLLGRMGMGDNNFRDLIALVALYRPGPLNSGMTDKFINRKRGYEEITYVHPAMQPILQETYGVIVYQEQIMQLAVKLCGFSMARGDVLRKAMGKKKKDVMDAMRGEFVQGGMQTSGLPESQMTQMFEEIEKFAAYGFNKSHSTCYALIAYWTAYLKAHYTVEFIASLLTSVADKEGKVKEYFLEAKRLNIPVLTPDVNESLRGFDVTVNNEIRYGFSAIRNLGEVAVDSVIEKRSEDGRFVSLEDFCSRVKVSKKVVQSLIKCGSFDQIANRAQLLAIVDKAVDTGRKVIKEEGEASLLDFDDEYDSRADITIELPNLEDWTNPEKGRSERETLGVSISHNPLDVAAGLFRNFQANASNIEDYVGQNGVEMAVVVSDVKSKTYSKGTMLYVDLMDNTGSMSAIAFNQVWEKSREIIVPDAILIIKGRVDKSMEKVQTIIDSVSVPTADQLESHINYYYIDVTGGNESQINMLQNVLASNMGDSPVVFILNGQEIKCGARVSINDQLMLSVDNIGFRNFKR